MGQGRASTFLCLHFGRSLTSLIAFLLFASRVYVQNDTLIKYLLDELTTYETDHSDALSPLQRDVVKSFNGDHERLAPASSEELRLLVLTIERHYEKTQTSLGTLANKVGSLEEALEALRLECTAAYLRTNSTHRVHGI